MTQNYILGFLSHNKKIFFQVNPNMLFICMNLLNLGIKLPLKKILTPLKSEYFKIQWLYLKVVKMASLNISSFIL